MAWSSEPGEHDGGDQSEHHQREIFGRAELERDLGEGRRERASSKVPTVPAKNDPMAAVASATPARPWRAI